jgi:hypothetical protein
MHVLKGSQIYPKIDKTIYILTKLEAYLSMYCPFNHTNCAEYILWFLVSQEFDGSILS